MTHPVRRAYREAWRTRKRTGDASAEVLLRALRGHQVAAVFTDPDHELHHWLFGLWARGVPPARLRIESHKLLGRQTRTGVKALADVARAVRRNLE